MEHTQALRLIFKLLFIFVLLLLTQQVNGVERNLQVIDSVNAGGDEHIDSNGILFKSDPLRGKIGTESDYGKSLEKIGRVPQADEILYQTERYCSESFGYDLKIAGDGEYVLVLKFCEVYFNAPNMKVFDVILNGEHKVVNDLDIFQQVGRGVAYDEYIYFTISRGRLYYKDHESEIRGGKINVSFMKKNKDNPKINAIALLKGDVKKLSKLPQLLNEDMQMLPVEKLEPEVINEEIIQKPTAKSRKTSGPKQPNPYSMDDSSVMLPVFIAIGAFIPLLFCLCKL